MKQFKSIMKGFNKTIAKLDKLVALQAQAIDKNNVAMEKLRAENIELMQESNAAASAARSLRKLVEGDE